MSRFNLTRHLPYTAQQLIDLVSDVGVYPQFIPWISQLRTYNHNVVDTSKQFDADVSVGFKVFSETFSTRVLCDPIANSIEMGLIRGPFRKLKGIWTFIPTETGTSVTLDMDMEIANPLLNMVFKANFERAASKIMGVFEARAAVLFK